MLTLYHRQVAEWVKAHFVDEATWNAHGRLATYFSKQPLHMSLAAGGKNRAQPWNDVNRRKMDEEAWQTFHSCDYERLRDLLANIELIFVFTDEGRIDEIIGYWKKLSDLYSVRDVYSAAIQQFDREIKPDADYYATGLNNVARIYRAIGEFDGATDLLSTALARLQGTASFMTPETATTYNNLGILHAERDNLVGAEQAFLSEILILSNIAPGTPILLKARNNLTQHYIFTGNFDKAEKSSQASFDILDAAKKILVAKTNESESALIVSSAHLDAESAYVWANWSKIKQHKGEKHAAMSAQEKAVAFANTTPQCPPSELAHLLYVLGALYNSVNQIDKQYRVLLRARGALDREVIPDHLHHSFITARLVHMELHRKNLTQADKRLNELVQQLGEIRSLDDGVLTNNLLSLAADLTRHGLHSGAERLFRAFIALLTRLNSGSTRDAAIVYHELSLHYVSQKDYSAALEAAETAFEIYRQVKDGLGIINTSQLLANIQYECVRIDAAEDALRRGIAHLCEVNGMEAPTGHLWKSLALLLAKQELWEQAVHCYRKACDCYQHGDPGQFAEPRARSLAYLGEALEKLEQRKDAEVYYRRAIELAKEQLGEQHRFTVEALGMLVEMLNRQGRDDEAAEIISNQAVIMRDYKPDN